MGKRKILEPGTAVKLTNEYVAWLSEWTETIFGTPKNVNEAKELCMHQYSKPLNLPVHGIVIADNGFIHGYNSDCFGYLVWYGNELGEHTAYIEPKHLTVLKGA
jgi:hypothetical protein